MGKTYDEMARDVMRQYEADAYAFTCDAILRSHQTGIYPSADQKLILDAISVPDSKVAVKSGHGCGKSTVECWAIEWFLSVFNECEVPVTATSSKQLYDIIWGYLSKWKEHTVPIFKNMLVVTSDRMYVAGQQLTRYATARTARRETPDALQGFHAPHILFIIEEASGVHDSIFELAEGSQTTLDCRMLLCGNPTRLSGFFHRCFNADRKFWNCITLNGEKSSLVNPKYIERQKRYGTDSDIYRVRVLGEFPKESADTIIQLNLLEDAKNRDILLPPSAPRIAGLDVARFGDDKTAIVIRQGGVITYIDEWEKKDAEYTVGKVLNLYRDRKLFDRIQVDVIGMGGPVVDTLTRMNVPTVAVNVCETSAFADKYDKLRDELWFKAQEFYMSKLCKIDVELIAKNTIGASKGESAQIAKENIDEMISQLSSVKYGFSLRSGKLQAESKDDMKARKLPSPNLADAHNLTFAEGMMEQRSISGERREVKVVSMNKYV